MNILDHKYYATLLCLSLVFISEFSLSTRNLMADSRLIANTKNASLNLPKETVINSVLASVNGKPITLQDLSQRLQPPRNISIQEIRSDHEANALLDALVMEQVVLSEAESRRISVADEEVERYLDEIANRNNLSRPGFEKALADQKKSITDYRRFIKVDILKTKLASAIMHTGASVSKEEVEQYLREHPELSQSGTQMKLAQILVSTSRYGETIAQSRMQMALEKLSQGLDFAVVAREFSDGPESQEGGLLGTIAEKDLQTEIFDALFQLKPGQVSKVIQTPAGLTVFQLIERFQNEDSAAAKAKLEAEIRKTLSQQKLESKMSSYFSSEIMKNHSIDRKV